MAVTIGMVAGIAISASCTSDENLKISESTPYANLLAELADYPQCNWGWNGYHDGYFLSEAFDASKQATFPDWEQPSGSADINSGNENNYQYKVEVVTGIRK